MKNKTFLISILLLVAVRITAQISYMQEEVSSAFLKGMEFYNKEKYPAAIKFLDSYLKESSDKDINRNYEAEFYSAMAALRLFNLDAEYRMNRFIASYPGSSKSNEGYMALGDYFYQTKNYRKAVNYYKHVNRLLLAPDKLPEYFFRYGYSLFMNGDKQTALLMFSEIKDIDTYYTAPALYYFSHIAYEEKKYETAMEGFMKLRSDETFGSVVPFYIVQVMYMKKDYDGILELAPDLLKSAGKMRAVELYRFIGDAYYNKGNYKEAAGYLEKYAAGAKASDREDRYQLGYCYYMNGEYDKALKILLDLTAKSDLLSQNVWFVIGDCYLEKNDKNRAQFAFGQASLLNFDQKLKEEALFTYAKLLYETSSSPFGEAIRAFQEYINLYPGSDRIEEVYDYLLSTYMQIKNYKEALASLDRITRMNPRLEEAYQRVAFYRGLELFKNMQMTEALNMFEKSLKYEKYNRQLRARAIYWRGEAWYRLGQYDKAIADYQTFMGIPGASMLDEYNLVRYNLAYAFYNQKDYNNALAHFRAFESSATDVRPDILVDARNRIADCYFINTQYAEAIEFYDKVIAFGKVDADYALYQKGFSLGLSNNQRAKAETLTMLIDNYPASKYLPSALFERGRAWVSLREKARAENDFNRVINSYPNTPFAPRAIIQLGLLYYDSGENEKAIAQFKNVIENYSSTPEARSALTGLKNAYIEINDVESYFAYVKSIKGLPDINQAEKDSLLYVSGERLYMAGNCSRASEIFRNYLEQFSFGSFRINVLFYLAECSRINGNIDEALVNYEKVLESPGSSFYEPALQSAAAIVLNKEDYLKAFTYYERLEKVTGNQEVLIDALRGQLKAAYQAGDPEKTISAAGKISSTQSVPDELQREATFMSAKAYYSLNRYDEALNEFRKTAGEITSLQGAESKYRVAELLFLKGNMTEAEDVINDFINMNTPHQYWMAKAFLLLADINIKKGDLIFARATLQGLKENYPVKNDGIIEEVNNKLSSLEPRQIP